MHVVSPHSGLYAAIPGTTTWCAAGLGAHPYPTHPPTPFQLEWGELIAINSHPHISEPAFY